MVQLSIRPLTAQDLAQRESAVLGSSAPPLKRIRHTHHKLARLLAQGINATDAGLIAGFSPSRVSILRNDPSFAALVEHYTKNIEGAFAEFVDKLKDLSVDAVDELRERLEEEPETFDISDLIKVASFGADRSGHGPTHRQEHDLTPEASAKIDALKQAVIEHQRGRIIEARPEAQRTEESRGENGYDHSSGETPSIRPTLVGPDFRPAGNSDPEGDEREEEVEGDAEGGTEI